jgi:hypothetical protein
MAMDMRRHQMNTKEKCTLWARVRISSNHGLRANQTGLVIDEKGPPQKRWLVQFDERYPGGGIDGDKLSLDEHDFADIAPSGNVNAVAASCVNMPSLAD